MKPYDGITLGKQYKKCATDGALEDLQLSRQHGSTVRPSAKSVNKVSMCTSSLMASFLHHPQALAYHSIPSTSKHTTPLITLTNLLIPYNLAQSIFILRRSVWCLVCCEAAYTTPGHLNR